MPYKYHNPSTVKSPADLVRSVKVIYDGGDDDVSAAIIDWEGKKCLGIRWNVARREWGEPEKKKGNVICVGMPSSRGYPVWFILPLDLLDINSDLWQKVQEFKEEIDHE